MSERRTLRGLPLVGVAFAGMVLGHWLSYLVGLPNAHLRTEVLAATNHGYWSRAVYAAMALAALAGGSVALRRFRAILAHDRAEPEGPGTMALRLAVLQVLGFTAMEVTERLLAGAPLSSLLQHHLFLLGLLVQVGVAGLAALVVFALARAADAVAGAMVRARFPRPARRSFPPTLLPAPRPAILAVGAGPRGPPSR